MIRTAIERFQKCHDMAAEVRKDLLAQDEFLAEIPYGRGPSIVDLPLYYRPGELIPVGEFDPRRVQPTANVINAVLRRSASQKAWRMRRMGR